MMAKLLSRVHNRATMARVGTRKYAYNILFGLIAFILGYSHLLIHSHIRCINQGDGASRNDPLAPSRLLYCC